MNEQLVIQNLLQRKLFETRSKNPAFSLRAFAKKLKIGAGPLSQILSGHRRISMRMAERICSALVLEGTEKSQILAQFATAKKRNAAEAETEVVVQLTADHCKVLSEWYHTAILQLIRTKDFKWEATWISSRLAITHEEAEQALERLHRINMVVFDDHGNVHRTRIHTTSPDEVVNLSLRQQHRQVFGRASESMEQDPLWLRDFTGVTLPTEPSLLAKAKTHIRKFRKEMTKLLMATNCPTEVYRLSIQLFPLSRVNVDEIPEPGRPKHYRE